jgi:cell division septation protein DedD
VRDLVHLSQLFGEEHRAARRLDLCDERVQAVLATGDDDDTKANAEYRPVLNNASSVPLASLWRSWTYQGTSAFHPPALAPAQKLLPPPRAFSEKTPEDRIVGRPNWRVWAVSAAALAVLAVGYLSRSALMRRNAEPTRPLQPARAQQSVDTRAASLPAVRTDHAQEWAPSPAIAPNAAAVSGSAATNPPPNQNSQGQAVELQPVRPALKTAKGNSGARKTTASKTAPLHYAGKSSWTVQVRASARRGEANDVLGRLKARGYDAFLAETDIKGRMWYRVRVGNFASQQQAELMEKKLRNKEGLRHAFVANNSAAVVLAAESQ